MSKNRLHLVYFGLAAFDIITISCTLFLSHQIMSIHEQGVLTSRAWADRLGAFTELGAMAQAANAPGNDVFDTHDATAERARRDEALATFTAHREAMLADLRANVEEGERAPIEAALKQTDLAMAAMVAEADAIFRQFERGRPDLAGRRMATMDRVYAQLTRSIASAVNEVQAIQVRHLEAQSETAQAFRRLEFLIGALIIVIVCCVAVYGHMIGRVMRRNEARLQQMAEELKEERDQLERRVLERTEELAQATELAQSANVAKSQFLANMSHELRTPLNAVIGYSEIMLEAANDDGRASDVADHTRVLGAARRLLTLINEVLDLSKIEAGRVEVEAASFSIDTLMTDIAGVVRPLVEANGNRLLVEIEPGLESAVNDSFKLTQCVLNLVSNAAKFTKDGEVAVRVWREAGEGGEMLMFEVRDTGVGIAPEQLGRLFTPFTQADASTTRLYGGTGLGLVISREYARLMGGDVSVTSVLGQGSTFRLSVLAHFGAVQAGEAPVQAVALAPDMRPVIVVIDDDTDVRDIAIRRLEPVGFTVLTAHNAESGLALARSSNPALIVLDIHLPDRSGWDILPELAALDTPVLVASVEDARTRALAAGACECLMKPFDADTYVAAALRFARLRPATPVETDSGDERDYLIA